MPYRAPVVNASHVAPTRGAPFANTVAAIAHALPDEAHIWLDVLAVREWPGNKRDLDFEPTIAATDGFLLCTTHVEALAKLNTLKMNIGVYKKKHTLPQAALDTCAFFRVWCLVEARTVRFFISDFQ